MMVFKWLPRNYRTTDLRCSMIIADTFIIASKEMKKTWRIHNKKMFDTNWDFFSWITSVYKWWRSNHRKEYSVRYKTTVRHKSQLSKSSKGSKCGKLSTESKPKMNYTCVEFQENYYKKITCKRAPLRSSDKDIHVQLNQEDKLVILSKHFSWPMCTCLRLAGILYGSTWILSFQQEFSNWLQAFLNRLRTFFQINCLSNLENWCKCIM